MKLKTGVKFSHKDETPEGEVEGSRKRDPGQIRRENSLLDTRTVGKTAIDTFSRRIEMEPDGLGDPEAVNDPATLRGTGAAMRCAGINVICFCTNPLGCSLNTNVNIIMSRTLYSPKLSDDVVRALYREGQRRRMPMTRLADILLRQSLGAVADIPPILHLREEESEANPIRESDAA